MAWHLHCSSCSQRCWRYCLLEKARQASRDLGRCRCPACPARSKQATSCVLQLPRTWASLCLLACKSYQGAQILKNLSGHLTQGSAPTGSCLLQVHSWVMMVFLQAQRMLDSASPLCRHPHFSKTRTVTTSSALWTMVWGDLSIRGPLSISDHWVVFFSQLVRSMFVTMRDMVSATWLPSEQLPPYITQRRTFTAWCKGERCHSATVLPV